MDGLTFLGAAYTLVWLGIAIYLFSISRRQRALERRILALKQPEKTEIDSSPKP
jgi:CcmD family protein